ncbi:tRNA 5-carboxymethoxyuridine methyltransferase [Pseudoalteromonas holothuriae]|uniref:tRNA 5-carboxymethoxyuridine methyltransferase n=1 Tax=Pseudoalteromonas holothuriae TaxID=2963714 RepID=A0A9W4QWX6_9GAMM|nr:MULTISPECIES: class I SAM-dependent methyltransferase [unclassified Pseudoalteromonas]CAH9054262.1 tRNA 5-carboxymethoxyuridine methyltransferase [Pseudoalteromonas sp. CIP111951]CAH9056925.1 tRNA 5-carboxymethoxyuridine methyltransferase [Pseudoalteromonas sp. CIP111854]
MSKFNWQAIYEAGEQLNQYPYDFVVSHFFKLKRACKNKQLKVLDLGCGAGNHAIFCAEQGAQVVACDFSIAALKVVDKRAKEKGLEDKITTYQVDFDDFQLPYSSFDIVIDRLAVTNVSHKSASSVYECVYDAMSKGGSVIANFFTDMHSHKNFGQYCEQEQVWKNFSGGMFEPLKTANFYTHMQILQLFNQYQFTALNKETDESVLANNDSCLSTWKLLAKKC